jgi:sarcosine oxidase, subunit beta
MTAPSVVIVGAGSAGINAAWHLAERGCAVTVLERLHVASGSTGLSAGVFNINGTDRLSVVLRVTARELLSRFEAENGLHLARNGHLRLGRQKNHVSMFEEAIEVQRELGVSEPSVLLDPEQIRELAPEIVVDDVIIGLYNDRDGHMDGPLLCGVLGDLAAAKGARIVTNSPVIEATRERGRHILRTPDATYEADVVVNAAGPWAERVGDLLGAPLPLVNQVHDMIRAKLPASRDVPIPMVQEYNPGDDAAVYFRQDGPDTLLGGEHTYVILDKLERADPDNYRKTVPWNVWESVARQIDARLSIKGIGFEPGWTGLYPLSADNEWVVGPYEHDETIIAFGGMGGAGVTGGVSLGGVVTDWITAGEPRSLPEVQRMLPDRPSLREAAAGA